MTSHSERVDKVRSYFEKNKLFSMIVVVIAIVIIGNFVMNGITAIKEKDKPTSSASEGTVENHRPQASEQVIQKAPRRRRSHPKSHRRDESEE